MVYFVGFIAVKFARAYLDVGWWIWLLWALFVLIECGSQAEAQPTIADLKAGIDRIVSLIESIQARQARGGLQ